MSTQYLFAALKAKVGNASRKMILVTLADVADEKGHCWPSHAYLADRAECSRRSVINHLEILKQDGFISIQNRSKDGIKTSNVYQINDVQNLHIDNVQQCPVVSSDDVQDLHIDVQNLHGGSAESAHKPPIEPISLTVKHGGFDYGHHPESIHSQLVEFIDHRKNIKKPLTQNGLDRFVQQAVSIANKMDIPVQLVITETIDAGWQGAKLEWMQRRLGQGDQQQPHQRAQRQPDPASTRGRTIEQDLNDTSWAQSH